MLCPCCSGKAYADCCERYHCGELPSTPLALMRSRYSAYALKKSDYILETTHPKSPYFEKDRAKWKRAIEQFSEETKFLRLEIVDSGEDWVFFKAHLEQKEKPICLSEKSRFAKEGSKWLYLLGEVTQE